MVTTAPKNSPRPKLPNGVRIYAIADIHGCAHLLEQMFAVIDADMANSRPYRAIEVFLGDYIDRGPDSKGVIDFLIAAAERDERNLFLAGNHDVGLLEFLAEPDPDGIFMRYGGRQTAKSYGVELEAWQSNFLSRHATGSDSLLKAEHAALVAAIPRAHVEFLLSLSFSADFGDLFFCHAGIRPGVPLDRQDPQDLIWIRREFLDHPRLYDKVIVHGHTPVPEPVVTPNRVDVDTYAWHSGRLTALVVDGAAKQLLSVADDGTVQRSDAVTP